MVIIILQKKNKILLLKMFIFLLNKNYYDNYTNNYLLFIKKIENI